MKAAIISLAAAFLTCVFALPAEECRYPEHPTHLRCPRFTPFTSFSEVVYTLTPSGTTAYSYSVSTITGIASRSCPTHTDTEPGIGPSGTCTVDLQTCSYSQCIATTTTTLSCPPLSTDPCCTNTKTVTVYTGCPPPTCVPGCSSTVTETLHPPCAAPPPPSLAKTVTPLPIPEASGTPPA